LEPPPLYRIDLFRVFSKYIGETEKKLRRVLDPAGFL
jgi:SpoVK/Ycf46/Vps4 family AAA+-type ATPase